MRFSYDIDTGQEILYIHTLWIFDTYIFCLLFPLLSLLSWMENNNFMIYP